MTPFLADQDFTLYVGDVREVLAGLPDASVDCVVTSPPYWGLRDYGTGSWEGGDEDCDHKTRTRNEMAADVERRGYAPGSNFANYQAGYESGDTFKDVCGKCGARRQDQQLGLEPTPDLYVQNMVAVFREVRRVLADHGTCWVNLGDSYTSGSARAMATRADTPAGLRSSRQDSPPLGSRDRLKPKDLVGIPWRVAFALQADGWYLRSDIIWAKPNPMPESVTDRPTKAHEYVFLLSKRPRYWFDAEAVREPHKPSTIARGEYGHRSAFKGQHNGSPSDQRHQEGKQYDRLADAMNPAGRNVRSVWEIATQPYPEAHFAAYPEDLVRRCVLAGCPERVCRTCGKPRERIVDVFYDPTTRTPAPNKGHLGAFGERAANMTRDGFVPNREKKSETVGWSDCGHNDYRPGVVLDPFLGSGTTALVARKHGRHTIGIELNPAYAELIAKRTRQLSLLAEGDA